MEIKAHLKYLRISPRKARLVASAVKGFSLDKAESQLNFLIKRSSDPIKKLLKSAEANAKHNFNIDKSSLYVANILVNEGPTLKRWIPRAQGRATEIFKRTSHITVVLGGIESRDKTGRQIINPKPESKSEAKEDRDEPKKDNKARKAIFDKEWNDKKGIKGSQNVDGGKKFQRRKAI